VLHTFDLATADAGSLLAGAAAVLHLAARPGVRASFGPGFTGYLHDNLLGYRPQTDLAAGLAAQVAWAARRPRAAAG
jgi:hypothetical protein